MANPPSTFPLIATLYNKSTPDQNTQAGQIRVAQANIVAQAPGWIETNNYNASASFGVYLKTLNPALCLLAYYHSLAYDPHMWLDIAPAGIDFQINGQQYYPFLPEWILCDAGTTVKVGTSQSSTSTALASDTLQLTATDAKMVNGSFVVVGTVASGMEVQRITANGGTASMTTQRMAFSMGTAGTQSGGVVTSMTGSYLTGPAHAAGEYVRACIPSEGGTTFLALNVTTSCPTSARYSAVATWPDGSSATTALTFNQFLGKFLSMKLQYDLKYSGGKVDGIFFDNFDDRLIFQWGNNSLIDINNDNVAEGLTQTTFNAAMIDLADKVRTAIGGTALFQGNTGGHSGTTGSGQPANTGSYKTYYNSAMVEGVRHGAGQSGFYSGVQCGGTSHEYYDNNVSYAQDVAQNEGFMTDWLATAKAPAFFISNGSPVDTTAVGIATDYKAMRFLLAEACLLGASLAYDEYNITGGHQRFDWFDEFAINTTTAAPYPNSTIANGWLGLPTSNVFTVGTAKYRVFQNGIVFINYDQTASQAVPIPYVVKKFTGTQDASTNNGATGLTSVTIPAQDGLFTILVSSGGGRTTASTRTVASARTPATTRTVAGPRTSAG